MFLVLGVVGLVTFDRHPAGKKPLFGGRSLCFFSRPCIISRQRKRRYS